MELAVQPGELLLGDEAIGQGALDAGISGVYAYPGTPSTEITEYIQASPQAAERGVHREWSTNEKTAMEEALGMAYAGKRALVCMKHVGLNVASDAFVNAAITGTNGGLVIVVADDPSMHSSQNEQDTRFYARFAHVPLLEPCSQQEAYDMVRCAFDLSEEMSIPVVVRLTTRLAHSRSEVRREPPKPERGINLPTDNRQFVLLPANARKNYASLLEKQPRLLEISESSPYNIFIDGEDHMVGIIVTGIAYNYLREVYGQTPCPYPVVKIGQYPVPRFLLKKLVRTCESLLVIEEGYPFVEESLIGVVDVGLRIRGRLDGTLPRTGELTPDAVGEALGFEREAGFSVPDVVAPRPPSLCKGCPHSDSYAFLREALDGLDSSRVFSDIGCYTLGALPPYNAIHSCVDMGASITMAKGAADAGVRPSVAVIGDSTFTHSGMTGLLDGVYENTAMTVVILDNESVAMTGAQESLATGRLRKIVEGLGVDPDHIRIVTPMRKFHEENVAALREELAFEGLSVVIAERICIQAVKK